MSEVLTRSLITTSCTLLPVIALLLFGGSTLKDFAFALLIGVASGAYSSIFIASPVLTHWKEREHGYRLRRQRITEEFGYVPAYADGGDVDPTPKRVRSTGRLTAPADENVSAAEFEQMTRELGLDEDKPRRRPSRVTERMAHTVEDDEPASPKPRSSKQRSGTVPPPAAPPASEPQPGSERAAVDPDEPVAPAPDEAENDGVAPVQGGPSSPRRPRNRKHGRKR
jgi:SecD/SecF fusion protein